MPTTQKSRIVDDNDILYLWQKIKLLLADKADKETVEKAIKDLDERVAEIEKNPIGVDEQARADIVLIKQDIKDLQDAGYLTETEVDTLINTALGSYYTKTEIDAKITSAVHYRGTVETTADLPTDAEIGDMYNVRTADSTLGLKAGDNVVWSGTEWDVQSGTIDTTKFLTTDDILTVVEMDEIYRQVFEPDSTT